MNVAVISLVAETVKNKLQHAFKQYAYDIVTLVNKGVLFFSKVRYFFLNHAEEQPKKPSLGFGHVEDKPTFTRKTGKKIKNIITLQKFSIF